MARAVSTGLDLRRLTADRPPVMLFDVGLDLIRPFALASIPVIAANLDPATLSWVSRYPVGRLALPPSTDPDADSIQVLMNAGAEIVGVLGRKIPLCYGRDETLRLLYEHGDELSRHYLFLVNDPALASALLYKDAFGALCRSKGLPVPRMFGWDPDSPDSIARADCPVLVKPTHKTDWHTSAVYREIFAGGGKAKIFASGRELMSDALCSKYRDLLVAQEYIPGGDDEIYSFHGFADRTSQILAYFCGKKIRTFPRNIGESTYLELVKSADLEAVGRRIISTLGFKGVFKIDFKRHAGTGRFYMLEINARFNLWHYLGAVSGVNLPAVAYRYLVHGIRPPADNYSTRYRWLDLYLDSKAYRELRSRGELSGAQWLRSLAFHRNVCSTFSWADPKPSLVWWARALKKKLA